jgi:hypothetical protein
VIAFLIASLALQIYYGHPSMNVTLDELARSSSFPPVDINDVQPLIMNESEAPSAGSPQVHDEVSFEQVFNCKGLIVGSAYYEPFVDMLTIHMTTGYIPWKSYTPFASSTIRCSLSSQMGGYLETYKHYSSCSIPYKAKVDTRELVIDIIDVDSSSICKIKVLRLVKRQLPYRYTLSALTTVQNSASYFREWFNFGFCTGWSHFYVYDDVSNEDMQEVLSSLRGSGHLTYTNWSHVGDHGSRQFMAMQDFLIRFRHETLYVSQMDDDCYFLAQQPSTNFAKAVQNYFQVSDQAQTCQIQASSYWFGHGWTKSRSEPMVLSSFLRADTSLSSKTVRWPDEKGQYRDVDATLSIARTDDIFAASGITHKWDMKGCQTMPVNPPDALYFAHYKMKPWFEKAVSPIGKGSWGGYHRNETFWNMTALFLHQIEDNTMRHLDHKLNLSFTLTLSDRNVLEKQCSEAPT